MKKRSLPRRKASPTRAESLFPFVDSRIFPNIISFRYVKGPLRLFLKTEMILALLVVIGSCVVVILKTLGL